MSTWSYTSNEVDLQFAESEAVVFSHFTVNTTDTKLTGKGLISYSLDIGMISCLLSLRWHFDQGAILIHFPSQGIWQLLIPEIKM